MRILSLILLLCLPAYSQPISPSEILEKIRGQYSRMTDASASFTQSISLRYKKGGQVHTGTVAMKKKNMYRIVSESQTIVTDGATVWMYSPKTQQVLIDRFKGSRQPFSPEKILSGLPKELAATAAERSGDDYRLSLKPMKKSSSLGSFSALTVWAVAADWTIRKIELTDANGTVTTITLSDIEMNTGIPDSLFRFTITPEMHVVDLKTEQ